MKKKNEYHDKLKEEIEKDPKNQGYNSILKKDYTKEGEDFLKKGRGLRAQADDIIAESNDFISLGNAYKDERIIYAKIAEQLNRGRAEELGFPIVRTNVIQEILKKD